MIRLLLPGLLVVAGSLGIIPAAVADEEEGSRADDVTCFQTKRVHSVRPIDEYHVVAELLGGKRYVLGVESRCRGLDKAVKFTIKSRGTRVCSASFAELFFTDRSRRGDRCRIETVEALIEGSLEGDPDASAEDGRVD